MANTLGKTGAVPLQHSAGVLSVLYALLLDRFFWTRIEADCYAVFYDVGQKINLRNRENERQDREKCV